MRDNFEITDIEIGDIVYFEHPMGTWMGPFNVHMIDMENNYVIDKLDGSSKYRIPFKRVVRVYREDELIWKRDYKDMQTE